MDGPVSARPFKIRIFADLEKMRIFPESALVQLEFDKVRTLLAGQCSTEYARAKAEDLRIHTRREFIELELQQSNEFKLLLQNGQYFPNDDTLNLARELKLLGIPGATLSRSEEHTSELQSPA